MQCCGNEAVAASLQAWLRDWQYVAPEQRKRRKAAEDSDGEELAWADVSPSVICIRVLAHKACTSCSTCTACCSSDGLSQPPGLLDPSATIDLRQSCAKQGKCLQDEAPEQSAAGCSTAYLHGPVGCGKSAALAAVAQVGVPCPLTALQLTAIATHWSCL